jgi:hypothetical protein
MIYDQEHPATVGSDMDEPVPRRNFVRLVASDAVQTAGRIASLSGAAAGVVAHGMATLTGAFDESASDPGPSVIPARGGPPGVGRHIPPATSTSPGTPRLDDATRRLLEVVDRGWLAVNRRAAGPLVLPAEFRYEHDRLSIRGRAGSAMALAVMGDGHVTLILDDTELHQRCLVFGSARVLEGAAAAAADGSGNEDASTVVSEGALIVIEPTHAVRMPG